MIIVADEYRALVRYIENTERMQSMKKTLSLVLVLFAVLAAAPTQAVNTNVILAKGASGAEVAALQERLLAAGFLTGAVDGRYGDGTQKAVSSAQAALREKGYELAVDGIAGQQTLTLLFDDQVMEPFLTFGLGDSGPRVISLQKRLIDLKFLEGQADGCFGQQTQDALKAFQAHLAGQGLQVSGVADAATRALLQTDADLSGLGIRAPEFFDDSQPLTLSDEYLNAQAATLVDMRSGRILYQKHMDARHYPASTTKIMTLLLAVERGFLEEKVVLPAATGEVPRDSSLVPVYPGERMTMRDLLYGLMIRSGNDAANAIADICAGSVEGFVDRMNRRAAGLGLRGTHFTNPHGYHHAEHYTTARDLAILTMNAMANEDFAAIASALVYEMPATQKRGVLLIKNSNELLIPSSPFYYEAAVGIKSGYTSYAGFCYVGAAVREEQRLLVVILGSRTRDRGWDDMARLFNYGFAALNR